MVKYESLLGHALVGVFALASASCKASQSQGPNVSKDTARKYWTDPATKVCLVLSVGGPKGVAHLGAIEAVKRARHEVDCVIGTSFGALAGSMYATAPSEYVPDRYLAFMDAYVTRTRADKEQGFLGGLVIGGLIGAATGGIGLAIGALGGGQLGAEAVYERDRKRFVNVLHEFYGGAVIERLPVRFATLYQERATYGLRPRRVQIGDLSNAVGASAANPLIFQDVNVRADQAIDPGVDRVAAVPVEDACQLFPRAALIAINVTDQAAFFSGAMRCPLLEVRVPLQQEDVQALTRGPKFDAYVKAGFDATAQALAANP